MPRRTETETETEREEARGRKLEGRRKIEGGRDGARERGWSELRERGREGERDKEEYGGKEGGDSERGWRVSDMGREGWGEGGKYGGYSNVCLSYSAKAKSGTYTVSEWAFFNLSKIHKKFKQHPIKIKNTPMTWCTCSGGGNRQQHKL